MKKRILALTLIVAGLPSCIKISASPFDTSQGADGLAGLLATTYAYLLLSAKTYVAVGDQGKGYISTDGRTWTQVTVTSSSTTLTGVRYAGSAFFATGYGATTALLFRSTDGLTWTQVLSVSGATGIKFEDIAYANGRLVVVGDTAIGTLGRTSTDGGTTWSTVTFPAGNGLGKIVHDGTNFVTTEDSNGGGVLTYKSTDGITFTATSQPLTGAKGNVTGDLLVASGRVVYMGSNPISTPAPPYSASTTNQGSSWTANSVTPMGNNGVGEIGRALAYNGSRLEAVGDNCRVDFTTNLTSLSWSSTALTMSGCSAINWKGMIWDGSKFVAVGSSGKFAASATGASTDWTYTTLGSSNVNAIAVR